MVSVVAVASCELIAQQSDAFSAFSAFRDPCIYGHMWTSVRNRCVCTFHLRSLQCLPKFITPCFEDCFLTWKCVNARGWI